MFPIEMKIVVNNSAELATITTAVLSARRGESPPNVVGGAPDTITRSDAEVQKMREEAKAAAGKAADKVVADTSKKVDTLQKKEEPKPEANGEKTYTVEDAKGLTTSSVKAGKRTEIVALLKKYGVEVAAKLPEENIAEFCREAEALVGAAS